MTHRDQRTRIVHVSGLLTGLGIGLVTPCFFTMALADAKRGTEGGATSGVQVLRALGSGLGAGVAGLVFRLAVPAELFRLLGNTDPAGAIRSAGFAAFLDSALIHCWIAALVFIALSATIVLRVPAVRSDRATPVEVAV